MARDVTEKQLRVYRALRQAITTTGKCPTVRELAHTLDLNSTTTWFHLQALERKGLVRRNRTRRHRPWEIVGVPMDLPLRLAVNEVLEKAARACAKIQPAEAGGRVFAEVVRSFKLEVPQ